MDQNIGESISKARKKYGITQQDLAKDIGVVSSWVSRVEAGTVKPTIARLSQIERALELKPGKLDYSYEARRRYAETLSKKTRS